MSTRNAENFEQWIRNEFRELNTSLEEIYFAQEKKENVEGIGDNLKQQLLKEGSELISRLLVEGNTDEGFDSGFDLLGIPVPRRAISLDL